MNTADFQPVPHRRRYRWFQYSLRTLLVVTLFVSVAMSLVAVRIENAKRQKEAADAILAAAGNVEYQYYTVRSQSRSASRAAPKGLLRGVLGDDFFDTVIGVSFDGPRGCTPFPEDCDLVPLKSFPYLHRLDLSTGTVTDAGLANLKALQRLEQLYLMGTRITDDGLVHLKGFTRLTDLDLAYTRITDAGLVNLRGLQRLEQLSLGKTRITDAGLEHLKGLTELHVLLLGGTEVTDEGVKCLQHALPNCEVAR